MNCPTTNGWARSRAIHCPSVDYPKDFLIFIQFVAHLRKLESLRYIYQIHVNNYFAFNVEGLTSVCRHPPELQVGLYLRY